MSAVPYKVMGFYWINTCRIIKDNTYDIVNSICFLSKNTSLLPPNLTDFILFPQRMTWWKLKYNALQSPLQRARRFSIEDLWIFLKQYLQQLKCIRSLLIVLLG